MHLKSLVLQGFKSFAERTTFEFHEGITGIVGPNGCGKSNVVDAVRWVLGETSAKALRGGEMADVIFNGTDKRKALPMAEVSLNLTDCEDALKTDFHEVAITRRVFRDGKSEYRINDRLCRLRDIHELFMDTGIGQAAYSIMEQGKIDLLLSAKPEDRRQVFEEAAGITKFKREKKEALRKLEYTEANLLRVNDVLEEQARRINSLKRQVAKARRYQALANDVKILDTHLCHKRFSEQAAGREELVNSLKSIEKQRGSLELTLPEVEMEVVGARDKATNLESELSELRQRLSSHNNASHAAESRIRFNEERCKELRERIETNRDDLNVAEEKLAQQELDFSVSKEELDTLLKRIEERDQDLAQKTALVDELVNQRQSSARGLHEGREEAKRLEAALAAAEARIESAEASSAANRDRLRRLREEEEVLQVEIGELQTTEGELKGKIAEEEERTRQIEEQKLAEERSFQHARGDLEACRERRSELDRDLTARRSRLELLQQLLARGEGLKEGTQSVLAGLDDPHLIKPGLRGVLGSKLQVRGGFERAVEGALGSNLEAILVRDAELADAILDRLAQSGQGEVSIIAPDWVTPEYDRQLMTVPEGAECWVADCVESEEEVGSIVAKLLENILVVRDRAAAHVLRSQNPAWSCVTLDGEILRPEGIFRGGRAAGEAGKSMLERRKEVDELEEEVKHLGSVLHEESDKVLSHEHRSNELQASAEQAKDRLQRQQVELSTLHGRASLAVQEVSSFESKLANVTREQEEIQAREESANEARVSLESDLSEVRGRLEKVESEINRLSMELEELSRRETEEREEQGKLQTALAVERRAREAAEQQQVPIQTRIGELHELNTRRLAEIEEFERRIRSAEQEDEGLQEEIAERGRQGGKVEAELNDAGGRRGQLQQAINAAEASLSDLRHKIDQLGEQRGKEEVALAKIEMQLEKLLESVMERYQVDLQTFEPDSHTLLTCMMEQRKAMRALEKRRATLASKADDEGKVSPDASEEGSSEGVDIDQEEVSAQQEEELASIAGRVEEELENIELEDGPEWNFIEIAVAELRGKLDSMGPVNIDSIDEYEELEERHNFVKGQHDDLVIAKEELLNVIEKINTETTILFAETFEQVQTNFRKMFKELFGSNARADLILLDEGDPLDCGIEVIAKPPGKKLQSITLLSGGERSMTAVALLFSIYMVKPSPFCVLDELDAPLDESNIGRFLKVLDRFVEQSQFIIVTHNKRTMNRADVMYGVTMEEFGVSKPVGMRLTAADVGRGKAKGAASRAAQKLDGEE
ncbi:MAG: chromosome segregation protein SMC [Roseibacillus sp.]|nr:chromosome segregation protein SMC [Roseibacillus sp.]